MLPNLAIQKPHARSCGCLICACVLAKFSVPIRAINLSPLISLSPHHEHEPHKSESCSNHTASEVGPGKNKRTSPMSSKGLPLASVRICRISNLAADGNEPKTAN